MQVDARIDARRSVLPCLDAGDGAVGIEIAVLRVLREIDAAAVESRSDGELVVSAAPGDLPRCAVFILHFLRIEGDGVAGGIGVGSLENLRDARPFGERRVGGVRAAGWKSGVAGGGECSLIGRGYPIDISRERIRVGVAVDAFGSNIAIPGVA